MSFKILKLNYEILKLVSLIMPFFYKTKKSLQKFKSVKNEKSF